MEIRIINKKDEIVNISNMAKISVRGRCIVGMNEKQEVIVIEEYGSEEEARDRLIALGYAIEEGIKLDLKSQIIRT